MARRFLFVSWDGGGNVTPTLAMIRKLISAGHTAALLGNESLRQRTEGAGARFFSYTDLSAHDPRDPATDMVRPWEGQGPSGVAEIVRQRMLFGPASSIAGDTLQAVAAFKPDALGVDYVMFGGMLGAEASGIPWAVIIPHGYPLPHSGSRGRGPFTPLFQRMIAPGLEELNDARNALRLPPLSSVTGQYARAEKLVLTTYRFFDAPGPEVLPQAVYVGSQLDLPLRTGLLQQADSDRVLVSLSTAYQSQGALLMAVIGALSSLALPSLVLTGWAADKKEITGSANIEVRSFVPHAQALPSTKLVITHAGHGTLMGALEHGVPLLCLPCTMDQFDNAHRAAELGAAMHLPHHASPAELAAAIYTLCHQTTFRSSALALQERIFSEHHPSAALDALLSLC